MTPNTPQAASVTVTDAKLQIEALLFEYRHAEVGREKQVAHDKIVAAFVAQSRAQTAAPVAVGEVVEFCWCIESENSADWCFAADREGVLHNARFLDPSCIRSEPFKLFRIAAPEATTGSGQGESKNGEHHG